MSTFRVGTSGWVYPHWEGIFYPPDLPQDRWFAHYARQFDTVEVNYSFYRLPAPEQFVRWREQAPPGFLYAVKANRYLTHRKRLKDAAEPLQRFLERARLLEHTLGPILYQLPPRWQADPERLDAFARLLPRDLIHAFEFRDPRWFIPPVRQVLEQHNLAFCIFHAPEWECPLWVTGPAIYLRFHGAGVLYGGRYSRADLEIWAGRVREWLDRGYDVYAYFNNDAFGHAVANAAELREMVL